MSNPIRRTIVWGVGLLVLAVPAVATAQGLVSPGVGSINRSMGGASVGAPIDPIGTLQWNPAGISALPGNEVAFGFEIAMAEVRVASSLPASAFAPGVPPVLLAGANRSNSGVTPLFTAGIIYRPEDSDRWTFGVGLMTIGGLFTNLPASASNPILTPPPPLGVGTGQVYSRLGIQQISLTAACQLTDSLSVGFAPTISVADLQLAPNALVPPDDANTDGFFTPPNTFGARLHWALGFQVGVYYEPNSSWSFGASYKSPQWFEEFDFNATNELGLPRPASINADYPAIYSLGMAYRGFARTLLALDVRYTDFDNADTFKQSGFGPSGEVLGTGWQSVVSIHAGIQYECSEQTSLRIGYFYTENPIPNSQTSFNVAAPAFYQNILAVGASRQCTDAIKFSLAYYHSFASSIRGPFVTPTGPVAGSDINVDMWAHSLVVGLNITY